MTLLRIILLVLAAFCFLLSALGVSSPRVNITSLGLLLLTAAFIAV